MLSSSSAATSGAQTHSVHRSWSPACLPVLQAVFHFNSIAFAKETLSVAQRDMQIFAIKGFIHQKGEWKFHATLTVNGF